MAKWMALSMAMASAAWAGAPNEELPVPLKFSVGAQGGKGALLAGDLVLMPHRSTTVARWAPRGRERQELTVDLQPLDGGLYLVRAHWTDTTEDGEQVKWEPAFIVKRAATAEARLEFPGGARVLTLTAG